MTATACLDETTASRLVQGLLPNDVASESERHLLECSECLELVEASSSNDDLLAVLRAPQEVTLQESDDHLSAEVDALMEDLDGMAGAANSNASAFSEIKDLLKPTDSDQELGRFARFRILEVLGAGGMGIVLKAVDERIGRTVALKLMRPSLATKKEAKLRFQREAMAVASFEHEHIVTVYDVDEHQDTPYFTMELLEGESLRERLRRKEKVSVEDALRIAREIAVGLASAHERGQLHRDVKPDNVWLKSPNGQVKILDFGLVHSLDSNGSLTHSGTILGTPEYMAPEQACGEAIDPRCDLFSVGCVLYHMLTGKPPFQGKNVVGTLVAIANAVAKPPIEVDPQIPQPVSNLTMRLLQREPSDRLDSATAVASAIDQLLPNKQPVRLKLESPSRSWPWRLVAATGIAAVLAGVLAIKTNNGTLYIDTGANEDVAAIVDGEFVELRDKARKKTYELSVGASKIPKGSYEIVAKEKDSELVFSAKEFTLGRGDHQHIRVWLENSTFETRCE